MVSNLVHTAEGLTDAESIQRLQNAYDNEVKTLDAEIHRLEDRKAEVKRMIDALKLAYKALVSAGVVATVEAAARKAIDDDLAVKTIPQALTILMKRRGGRARIVDLIDDLVAGGRFSRDGSRHKAYAQVYRTLKDRPHLFRKLSEPGTFELVDAPHAGISTTSIHTS